MGSQEAVVLGFVGGMLSEVYGVYQLRKRSKGQRPAWLRSWFYWISTLAMILLGGGHCVVVSILWCLPESNFGHSFGCGNAHPHRCPLEK